MATPPNAADDIEQLLVSYLRHVRAGNLSEHTARTYGQSVNALIRYLRSLDEVPASVEDIDRPLIQDWVQHMFAAAPNSSTPLTRFVQVRTFFLWLVEEGELEVSPTKGMRDPKITAKPVPRVAEDALRALLKTCGNDFEGRRDEALMRAYADGGVRLNECLALDLDDVDMEQQVFWVRGKGDKVRAVPFGMKTARAVDRYLRARRKHPAAATSSRLWLGGKGPLRESGVRHMLHRRCDAAGIERVRPHQLRHTAAHELRRAGMNDQDMKRIFGWRSSKMLERYTESAADELALEAHRRLSFGDRL
ncbi:tyrosine-type recombinase/integrase [Actinomadura sp. 21ATH]|uniref:tyrosine-type recombinase/integrase n=1 Tax=Actinomadura sp. 21ATH TaxID=1735444 RepID=UPI0035C204E3